VATVAILKFLSLKIMCTHVRKLSGKFHPISSTIANQRWISIRNIIIYLEAKFRPNLRIFVFGSHFILWLPWQWSPFWIVSTPQKLPHTTVDIPTKWIIIWLPNHGYQFPTSKSTWKSNFVKIGGFLYFVIQNGHHSKPTMDINSQHHNLLGNQISPKSGIFLLSGHFVPHGNSPHFYFFQPTKATTHYGGYSYKFS
jgi:hypothetical protein